MKQLQKFAPSATRLLCIAVLVAMSNSTAEAAGVEGQGGFMSGLLHPVLGFDHLLAMVAVGLLSVQIGGRAVWTVPAAFVAFLIAGGAIGLAGIALPEVEGVIALSVLVLGTAIAAQARLPMVVAMAAVGLFAIFHGHAHGTEVPSLADPASYVIGFALASAFLHLAGVGLGLLAHRPHLRALLGAGIAGVGLHMVLLTYSVV
ncbi:MAG: HupE/UreJ family protein [Pseudomonadota bacterium]